MFADSSYKTGLKVPHKQVFVTAFFVEIYDTKYLVLMFENQVQNCH